jgi:ethanolamine utilization protein EutQ (cupin superfamily)
MTVKRTTQEIAETLSSSIPNARATQEMVEAISVFILTAKATQEIVEVISEFHLQAMTSQLIVETISPYVSPASSREWTTMLPNLLGTDMDTNLHVGADVTVV